MTVRPRPIITSPRNPLIKEITQLRERRWRDRLGQFPVEGCREVRKAIDAGAALHLLATCPELYTDSGAAQLVVAAGERGVTVVELSAALFARVSYRDRADGILAVALAMNRGLEEITPAAPALLLIVDAIEKPGNLGAVLRSGDGAGVDAVIVSDSVTDIYNPNVVRASLGTLFSRPVVQCTSEAALAWCRSRGIRVVAASPDAAPRYTDVDLSGDIAVVVGAEDKGLSARWLEGAEMAVRIPMRGDADSLNVAMAATLLLYEAVRQRGG